MKIEGHLAGGWLVSRWLTEKLTSNKKEYHRLLFLGTLAGVLPDADYLWYVIKKGRIVYKNDFRHHTWVSHTFPFYWIPASLLYSIGMLKNKPGLKNIASVLAAGTTIHLLQDTVGSGDGIMLFYPLSKRMDGLGLNGLHGDEWNAKYTKSRIYLVELAICLIGGFTFVYDMLKKKL